MCSWNSRYDSVRGKQFTEFSTSTYKHEFQLLTTGTTVLFVSNVFIFSISCSCQCITKRYCSVIPQTAVLTSFSPNLEFTEAYPIYRFAVTRINYIKKYFKRARFMLPGISFATLNVRTKKASLDAFCAFSDQLLLKLKREVVTPCTRFAEVTEDMKQLIPQTQILLKHSFLHIHAFQPSPPPMVAITSTFSSSSSSGPSAWPTELQLNQSGAHAARSLVFNLPVNQRSEIHSMLETLLFFVLFFLNLWIFSVCST